MNLAALLRALQTAAAIARAQREAEAAARADALEGVREGDALALLPLLPDASFDACITDPPFGLAKKQGLAWEFSSHVTLEEEWDHFTPLEYAAFTLEWLTQVCRVVKKNGNIVVFGSYHSINIVGALAQSMGLRIQNSIVWSKPNAQPNITGRMWCESTEYALWIVNAPNDGKDKATNWTFNYIAMKEENGGKQMRNVWEIPTTPASEKKFGKHPTQKPRRVIGRLVRALTNPGDRILDPFAGSGTTLVEAYARGRLALGIEREPEYVAIITARLAAMPDPSGQAVDDELAVAAPAPELINPAV